MNRHAECRGLVIRYHRGDQEFLVPVTAAAAADMPQALVILYVEVDVNRTIR